MTAKSSVFAFVQSPVDGKMPNSCVTLMILRASLPFRCTGEVCVHVRVHVCVRAFVREVTCLATFHV